MRSNWRFAFIVTVVVSVVLSVVEVVLLSLLAIRAPCDLISSLFIIAFFVVTTLPAIPLGAAFIAAFDSSAKGVLRYVLAMMPLYYAITLTALAFLPPWQKIVPNVERAYAEYKVKHPEPGRQRRYRQAEWLANVSKPVLDWLAK